MRLLYWHLREVFWQIAKLGWGKALGRCCEGKLIVSFPSAMKKILVLKQGSMAVIEQRVK